MELLTVIFIVAILFAIIVPAFGYMRARAERSKCVGNLKSIHVAAQLYVQDNGIWPQVDTTLFKTPAFATAWVAALAPYNLGAENWLCPTVQRLMNDPDVHKPENARIDYFATPFGPDRGLPFRYPTQPWFIERGDVHGDGNLMIFTNGDVKPLKDVLRDTQVQRLE